MNQGSRLEFHELQIVSKNIGKLFREEKVSSCPR